MNKYVDLGLPSGTLWSTCNVGAENIVGYGDYFTHNEAMECGVMLPTHEQFVELVENTTYKWVKNYNNCGVNGGLFIGRNGNEVFFPASSYCIKGSVYFQGSFGYYWSSSIYCNKSYAHYLNFDSVSVVWNLIHCSDFAFTLRGVKNK